MPDSIANISPTTQPAAVPDSTPAAPVYYAPQYSDGFPQPEPGDSVIKSLDSYPVMQAPSGVSPAQPLHSVLGDTGTMSLIMLGVFFVVISYRTGYKYVQAFFHNMFSARRRENLFEDHTVNETQILTALVLNTCIMEGVAVFYGVGAAMPNLLDHLHSAIFMHIGIYAGAALLFYLIQLLVYNLLGYIFADQVATRLWTDGFKASQSLLGILLFPVVAALLVWPQECKSLLTIAIILYILARIAFICKGFRIFYSNLPSLVYFILYLCSVEIVPLVMMCAGTVSLCTILEV